MENGEIPDSQISASSEYDANHGAINSRLNFRAQGRRQGAWSSRPNNLKQWLQVNFVRQATVTEILTQGRSNANQWVTSYTVSHSNDGLNFFAYRVNGVVKVWINKQMFLEMIYTFYGQCVSRKLSEIFSKIKLLSVTKSYINSQNKLFIRISHTKSILIVSLKIEKQWFTTHCVHNFRKLREIEIWLVIHLGWINLANFEKCSLTSRGWKLKIILHQTYYSLKENNLIWSFYF